MIKKLFQLINVLFKWVLFIIIPQPKIYLKYHPTDHMKDPINEKWGVFEYRGLSCSFISGRYGRGHAPRGIYKASNIYSYKEGTKEAKIMGRHGISFNIPIELKKLSKLCTIREQNRSEDMSGIGIHPDGGIEGTLGCFGLITYYPEILSHIKSITKKQLDKYGSIKVVVCDVD